MKFVLFENVKSIYNHLKKRSSNNDLFFIYRNVRGILEQLRAELKREENRRNELEREFLQQKIIWDRERKELHEEIFELQRTERMWLDHGDQSDARLVRLHFNENLTFVQRECFAQESPRVEK